MSLKLSSIVTFKVILFPLHLTLIVKVDKYKPCIFCARSIDSALLAIRDTRLSRIAW
jgi:hypothetical protein